MDALERIVLADPNGKAYEFAKSVFRNIQEIQKRERDLGFVFRDLKITEFPDGEYKIKIDSNARERAVILIHDSSKEPNRWLTEILNLNDAAMRASASSIMLVLPYMRWSRGDKKDEPHVSIPLKVCAEAIEATCGRVPKIRAVIMDLHSENTQGFFNFPVDCLESECIKSEYFAKNLPAVARGYVLVAPDHGSAKKVRQFANVLAKRLGISGGMDVVIIDKDRTTGEETKVWEVIGKEVLNGRRALMVDDILSTAGTLAGGADALRHYGATGVDAFITHYVGVGNYESNLKKLDNLYVTDTVYHERTKGENTQIISVAKWLAEAIYAASAGKSISRLFAD